ncbi:MAG: DUF1211 domain-containing protein [Burkholderiales bacterium]|nr:DUF1211 domain-containing protein [Anaerolineae bacterium]
MTVSFGQRFSPLTGVKLNNWLTVSSGWEKRTSKDRVEALSDGVFSIKLTLLVLELRVPNVADYSSLGQYAAAMALLIF